MMRKEILKAIVPLSLLLGSCNGATKEKESNPFDTSRLGMSVTGNENREYSYTDKKAGYYYGRTHENNFGEWFAGWNIAKKRIFSDYDLFVDGKQLDRKEATVTVFPDKLVRKFGKTEEVFQMSDLREILFIDLENIDGDSIGIKLHSTLLENPRTEEGMLLFSHNELPGKTVAIAPLNKTEIRYADGILSTSAQGEGFLIGMGTPAEARALIAEFRENGTTQIKERTERMNGILAAAMPSRSNLDSLDRALSWLLLTTDQLVTEQQGKGIYAGLPWFNEYWGRDMFISMPGATLVSGQFDVTKDILRDFSRFQDTLIHSVTRGRIPNRANHEGILYNTTDGTPRFVIQIQDYVKYSGDTDFIREIYPAVVLSIDAAIENHTDEKGYLLHADADTWMDVKREGIPGSPRGNRANDIQSLWEQQLQAGVYFARVMNDTEHQAKWEEVAKRLKRNFEKDFTKKSPAFIADHLNADGSQDMQFRPNQLYAYELIDDTDLKMELTRVVWEELVYPWGTASLSQWDDEFHPLHENWHYYHKDDAYHNGTVWLWNNGHAMQRMIEFNQQEIAWELFKNMNRQALVEGAVGSLSENADAHPREGASRAKLSGTFLQAWSNAEQLRVWYQYFLGIRPDLISNEIVAEPKLPAEITTLEWCEPIGKGSLKGSFSRTENETIYTFMLADLKATIDLRIPLFADTKVEMENGAILRAAVKGENMTLTVTAHDGKILSQKEHSVSKQKVEEKARQDRFFEGTTFCQPVFRKELKATRTYHEKPLTY